MDVCDAFWSRRDLFAMDELHLSWKGVDKFSDIIRVSCDGFGAGKVDK